MWPSFSHKRRYGRLALGRNRQRTGRGTGGGLQSCCGVMATTNRSRKLALGLPTRAWRKITWREGTAEPLSSRFARVRVRAAHRDYWLAESRPEEWLLIEWPYGEEAPTKYWFSTLPADIAFHQLVDTAKLRWRIERDYHELKQEVGLGHFEGRGWRGFHHHATLCIAAYGFLISERETIPPSETDSARLFEEITIPETYRPRGSALAA
jgi:SRSO17 transposase